MQASLGTITLAASACGAAVTPTPHPPVDVASDKPTLLFFYTNN